MAGDTTDTTDATDATPATEAAGTDATEAAAADEAGGFFDLLNPVTLPRRQQVGLLGLVALAVLPSVVREITLIKVTGALFFAVYAMTWDVVSGYTGEISFGHALFFGVGGYASGVLGLHLGLPMVVTIPAGVAAAALAGLVIGFPSLRLQGPYFSLVTLVAPIILLGVFKFFPNLTGGEVGIIGIPTLTGALSGRLTVLGVLTVSWGGTVADYFVAFGLFLFALAVFLAVTRSDAGVVLTAIREDELAVQAGGLNPAKYKLFAFLLSGAVGGLAGALFVHTYAGGVANPSDLLALTVSIEIIVAAILGGMGTITGAAVGGLFFFLLRDVIRNLEQLVIPLPPFGRLVVELTIPILNVPLREFDFLVFGVVTLVVLFVVPQGIVRWLIGAGRRLRARSGHNGGGNGGGGDPEAVADGGADSDESAAGKAPRGRNAAGRTTLERTVRRFGRELRALAGRRR